MFGSMNAMQLTSCFKYQWPTSKSTTRRRKISSDIYEYLCSKHKTYINMQ
jgi:hypothetical protein